MLSRLMIEQGDLLNTQLQYKSTLKYIMKPKRSTLTMRHFVKELRQTWTSKFQDYHILLWNTRKVPASVRELIQKIGNHPDRHALTWKNPGGRQRAGVFLLWSGRWRYQYHFLSRNLGTEDVTAGSCCPTRLDAMEEVEALRWLMQSVLPKQQGTRITWKKRRTGGKTPWCSGNKTEAAFRRLRIGAPKESEEALFQDIVVLEDVTLELEMEKELREAEKALWSHTCMEKYLTQWAEGDGCCQESPHSEGGIWTPKLQGGDLSLWRV